MYKYVRKTIQGSWNEKYIEQSIQETDLGSSNALTLKYTVHCGTLYRHVKSGSAEKRLRRFMTVFSYKQEKQLVEYVPVQLMDSLFYNFSSTCDSWEIYFIARREESSRNLHMTAEKNTIPHTFQNGAAGDVWSMDLLGDI